MKAISVNAKSNKATNKRLSWPPPSREEPKLAGPVWREIAPHRRTPSHFDVCARHQRVTLQVFMRRISLPPFLRGCRPFDPPGLLSSLFSLLHLSWHLAPPLSFATFLPAFLIAAIHPFLVYLCRIINWLPPFARRPSHGNPAEVIELEIPRYE